MSEPDVLTACDGRAVASDDETRWSIVLAGGRGARLAALTTVAGETIPKQYCSLAGGPSMLRRALWRAEAISGPERVLVVVTGEQRRWWERELRDLSAQNVLVQPADRGTAAGILMPLAEVLRRAPNATVAVMPSDHHVERETELHEALDLACQVARFGPRPIALVGVAPDDFDPELGWIVPMQGDLGAKARAVARFREKPPKAEAATLLAAGAVVNTFLFAARARALWQVCEELVPEVTGPLADALWPIGQPTYDALPTRDFSRAVFERATHRLAVVTAGPCGWSDLGTPERVARCLRRNSAPDQPATGVPNVMAALDLSRQVAATSCGAMAS